MNKTIVAAQDSGEQIRRIARQESDIILTEARSNANRIVSDALMRAEKTEFEAAQLRKNVTIFKRKLRSVIESQLDMVDDIETLDL
jgi:cell division initiation protein